ncbi:MAG: prolyl oligopeptidase family serine peptidase [Proteobacteria bacterium]|jgi:prolyl oligopeptidase|nr:prolyl oligopeptidase family serine peptidase [Pseudomonadota bacterium]
MKNNDPYHWLETIEGPESLDWVKAENQLTENLLSKHPQFLQTKHFVKQVMTDPSKIPYGWFKDDWYYNIWMDEKNPLGVLRRTKAEDLPKLSWQVVFDVDSYSQIKNQKWTIKSFEINPYDPSKALLSLSPGGKDECEIYEFDLEKCEIRPGGFFTSVSKQWASWQSADSILIHRGNPNSSGYPRNLYSLELNHKGPWPDPLHVLDQGFVMAHSYTEEVGPQVLRNFLSVSEDFFKTQYFEVRYHHELKMISSPENSYFVGCWNGGFLFFLNKDWQSFKSGDLLWRPENELSYQRLLGHESNQFVQFARVENQRLFVECLNDTLSSVYELMPDGSKKRLLIEQEEASPMADLHLSSFDSQRNRMTLIRSSFFEPESVWIQDPNGPWKLLFKGVAYFDPSPYKIEMHWAQSLDGTKVPFKVFARKDQNYPAPCWVHGYGGFQASLSLNYQPLITESWIKEGGIYIQAHLRGGCEFGPNWHQQSLKMNRRKCFEDFAAVIQEAQRLQLTTPEQTLIEGRSNGGLLVGATACLYPELMGAVICGVPLLDMERYHHLLAGASWAAEYGTIDDSEEMRNYLLSYSPYHQVEKAKHLPEFYIYTSTYDDRVHPGHARKMAAKLKSQKHSVYFFELLEGGHKGHLEPEAGAHSYALRISFAKEKTNYVPR